LTLEVEDVWALEDNTKYIDLVVPRLEDRGQIKYGNRNLNVRLVGTTDGYAELNGYEIAAGEMFTRADDESKRRVAVFGGVIPQQLEIENPGDVIGQQVAIRGVPFTVIGVLEEVGSERNSPDERVLLPLRTAEARVLGSEDLNDISVRVIDGVPLEVAMVDIERVLRTEHRILPGQANDFAIYDQKQFLETREAAQQTFTFLLASIAGVSLLVGGIGIMNIMLVSVTERTREIGVRMALGATRFNILLQFLIESMVLCMLGGIAGVLSGWGLAVLLSRTAGWAVYVSPESVVLAFVFSLGVGLFFGIMPARRAANLDPIEALRYE
jgi:putative ABC transport system permease protein